MTREDLFNNIMKVVNEELNKYFDDDNDNINTNTDSAVEDAINKHVLKLADFALEQGKNVYAIPRKYFNQYF